MSSGEEKGCLCMCEGNHPDKHGVCTDTEDMTLSFSSPRLGVGEIDVPMCSACAAATVLASAKNIDEEAG